MEAQKNHRQDRLAGIMTFGVIINWSCLIFCPHNQKIFFSTWLNPILPVNELKQTHKKEIKELLYKKVVFQLQDDILPLQFLCQEPHFHELKP